jgi:predicted DNA-binding protein with PD1-like motif
MGRLNNGDDLLDKITEFINQNKIKKRFISIIGAVTEAQIGYYDQKKKVYIKKSFKKPMEIISSTENISINEGKSFAHIHIVLADKTLSAIGGHLFSGTKVFAAEFFIVELCYFDVKITQF